MISPAFDVTSIGEILLRLTTARGQPLVLAQKLDIYPAGAEANVLTLLSRLGRKCAWIGALPHNSLGQMIVNHLRMAGVDLSGIVWHEPGRLGVFFVEDAGRPRGSTVIYDRSNSCTAQLTVEQIDWHSALDTRLIHVTGITPALSSNCRELIIKFLERARATGVPISFDINFRKKLWSEQEARNTLLPLLQGVELLFCRRDDASRLFGCTGTPEQIIEDLREQSAARHIVLTLSEEGLIAWDGTRTRRESAVSVEITDRIGAGDALAAGVIQGWLQDDFHRGLSYGVTLAALALSQYGDMVITTQEELDRLLLDQSDTLHR